MRMLPRRLVWLPFQIVRFVFNSYRRHWLATPAAAIAALVSTFGAATAMIPIAQITHAHFERPSAVVANAIIAPLLAYVGYLSVYYYGMFLKERRLLVDEEHTLDREKIREWFRVVRYDYLAHVPTDIYLISLAAIMQATLEGSGMPIFWAVVTSQFVDDFITFLKEPAIWHGAKELVAWENRENTTISRSLKKRLAPRRGS